MDRGNCALERFEKNNCAQSVFVSCCDLTGLDENTALALSSGFGGGLACGEVCGALCGAVMALGKIFYDENVGGPEAKARQRSIIKSCCDRFAAEFGSVRCGELIRKNGGKDKCSDFVAFCARTVEQLKEENA